MAGASLAAAREGLPASASQCLSRLVPARDSYTLPRRFPWRTSARRLPPGNHHTSSGAIFDKNRLNPSRAGITTRSTLELPS